MKKRLLIFSAICLSVTNGFKAQTTHERITIGTGEYDPNASWHGILRFENTESYSSGSGTSYTPEGIIPVTSCAYQSVLLNFVHGMYVREGTNEIYASTLFTNQNNILTTNVSVAVGSIAVFNNANSVNGATTPSRHIFGPATLLTQPHGLFVDTVNDRLYVANTFAGNILVFNNASTINGNTAPNRVISYSLTMGSVTNIDIDIPNDRMFLACMPSAPGLGGYNQPEVCIYNNASTINGSVAPDIRIYGSHTRLTIRNQTTHNIKYNSANKLLAVGHHTNELLIFDLSTYTLSVSGQVLDLTPRILLINEIAGTSNPTDTINHNLYGFFWDLSTDKVYISDGYSGASPGMAGGPQPGTLNKIKIYSNLSYTTTAGMITPDRVITWSNSTTYFPPQPIWITKTTTTVSVTLNVSAGVTICSGSSTTLTASGATSYSWYPSTGLNTNTGSSVIASPTVTTTYSVTGSNGSASTTKTITVGVGSTISISVSGNMTICSGNQTSLTASGGATGYSWYPSTNLNTNSGAVVIASPSVTSSYTITGTSSGCTDVTKGITIAVVTPSTITVSGNLTICKGSSTSLSANGAITAYTWSPSTGLNNPLSGVVTANPSTTITYTITGVGNNGCASSTTVKVTVGPIPTAAFSYTISGQTFNCEDLSTGGATSWYWTFSDNDGNTDTSTSKNPSFFTNLADGSYTICVTVTTQNGCISNTCTTILGGGIGEFAASNLLSIYPNPANSIVKIDYSRFNERIKSVKLLDMYGKEVLSKSDHFESIDISKVADGMYYIQIIGENQRAIKKLIIQKNE